MGTGDEAGRSPSTSAQNQGTPVAFLDPDAANRLKAATAATRERKQTFGASPVREILKREGETLPYRMPAGQVSGSLWKAGANGGDALRAALKASPEVIEPIKQIAAASLRAKAENGVITPKALEAWKKQYGPALSELEKASPGTLAAFETPAKAADHLATVAAQRKDALDAIQKGAVGRLMKLDHPSDVTREIGSIFGRKDAVKSMRALAEAAKKDPDAYQGLRKAVVDFMKDKLISHTEAATSGKNLIKADQFQSFLGKNHTALRQVFSDEELKAMRAIAQDLKRANRSIAALKLPGGSNTAQDLSAIASHDLKESLLSKIVFHGLGGALGFGVDGGLIGTGLGIVGSHFLSGLREAGIRSVDDLVKDAMLNPDLAKALMMKAPKRPDTGSELTAAAQLRKTAVLSALLAAPQKPQKRNGFQNGGNAGTSGATGEMRAYDPSLRDRIGDAVYDLFTGIGMPQKAQDARNITTTAADFLPGIGTALGADDTARAYDAGNYGRAGILGALTAMSLLPAGKIAGHLAMDEASRLARAADMGFKPMNWFHGTAQDVPAFEPGAIGSATGSPVQGFSFTRSPELAADFADLAAQKGAANAPNVIPARLKWQNPGVSPDLKGATLDPREIAATLQDAMDKGHDALVLRNIGMQVEGKPKRVSDIAVVLRPEQIRSVFAKFDPKNASSGDLLASLAGAGLLVGSPFVDRHNRGN